MRMEDGSLERRKELRYPLTAHVILSKENGERIAATAVDISSSGMQLRLDRPAALEADEVVTVEVELPDRPERPFSSWGIGRIAHLDSSRMGIELAGGCFAGQDEEPVDSSEGNQP